MTWGTLDQPSRDELRQMALGRWENEGGAEMPADLRDQSEGEKTGGEPTGSVPAANLALNPMHGMRAPEQSQPLDELARQVIEDGTL